MSSGLQRPLLAVAISQCQLQWSVVVPVPSAEILTYVQFVPINRTLVSTWSVGFICPFSALETHPS